MKTDKRNRIVLSWMLLLTFMFVHVVKDFHYYEHAYATINPSATNSESGSQHSTDDCPICHFTLSPYLLAESLVLDKVEFLLGESIIANIDDVLFCKSYQHFLRGPPSI